MVIQYRKCRKMSNSMSSNSLSSMEMMVDVDDDMTCMEDVEVGEVFDDVY